MKKLLLFNEFKSLSKNEFREFGKFVYSPYINNRSEVTRLYEAIKKFYPDFKAEKIAEEKLFKKIYPGKKFNSVLMRKAHSLIMILFQKYIVDKRFKKNRLHYELEVIESLRERKLFKLHSKKYRNYIKFLEESKETMEVYEYNYKSENEMRLNYEGLTSQIVKSTRSLNKIYSYFFAVILNEHLNIFSMVSDLHKISDVLLFDKILAHLDDSDYRKYPLINFYYLMVKLKLTGDISYFHELINFRNEYSDKLETEHNYNALVILLDYCLVNIGKGKSEFRKTMFELSQIFADEYLMNEKATEPITFTNIVRNCAILNHFDWAEQFISKYNANLHPSEKTSIINYCSGMIEFEKGNYSKALKLLSRLNLKWTNMKNDVKKIMIKCYYELGYFEELILQIDSYRHFVNSTNITGENVNHGNKYFIKYIARLNDHRISNDIFAAEALKKEAEHSEYFYHKEWIILKLNELIDDKRR